MNNWRVVNPGFRASCPNLTQAYLLAAQSRASRIYQGDSPVYRIEKARKDGAVVLRAWWEA